MFKDLSPSPLPSLRRRRGLGQEIRIKQETRFYHPELDSLRFLAFLAVFFNHSPYLGSTPFFIALHDYGWLGVDLFLGLSAYLITKLLLIEFERSGRIDFMYFYIRRALRIWPLYFFFAGLVFLFTLGEGDFRLGIARRFVGLASFTDNIFSAFLNFNRLIYSPHLWTISFEEQFYAVIPWTVARLAQATRLRQRLVLAVFFGLGTLLRALFIERDIPHPAIWVLPLTHFESILGGIAMGLGLFRPLQSKIAKWLSSLVGLFSLIGIILLPNNDFITWNLMLTYPLVGFCTSALLSVALNATSTFSRALLPNKAIAYLGKISYGLYIYHFAALRITEQIFERLNVPGSPLYPWGIAALGLALTILVSAASYRFLESPFLRWKERFAVVTSRPV